MPNLMSTDTVDIDAILDGELENEKAADPERPDEMGILPIRNAVAFPGTVMPLAIGRKRSKKLLDSVTPMQTVLGLLAQKKAETDRPGPDDLYQTGTAVSVLKIIKMPHGTINLIVHGMNRFRATEFTATEPYLRAKVEWLESKSRKSKKLQALLVNVKANASDVISLSPNVPDEAQVLLDNIDDASGLADFLAATLNIPVQAKQDLLEELNSTKRLEKVSVALANQLEVLKLSHKIQGQVRSSIDKSQREYYLQEELKAIQAELGQNDRRTEEIEDLHARIRQAKMPKPVEDETLRELDRMSKTPAASPDYGVIRTYLDWVCDLPWQIRTSDHKDISKAQRTLNRDHHSLKKIKKRILEFLAVRSLKPDGKSPILCFVGPPGVGKTSLGKSIANAMGRKFVRISLGGIRDEADIRGHRRTYIGALPGRILQELRKCNSKNPVFMLDEMDKIGQDFRGDPASALLEVLDPEQNKTFTDHYLDQPFDLSEIMFIGTANYTEPIPPALLDRMEQIELPGYTRNEKLKIAEKYLVPRQINEHGLKKNQITIKTEAISMLIDEYTREAGVRNLERSIAGICRHVAALIAKKQRRRMTIYKKNIASILGAVKYESEIALRTSTPGVATGLAYTPFGGEILFIESALIPGKGKLNLTGQLGDVMKESAQAALTVVSNMKEKLDIKESRFTQRDFHIHVPAGAVPKDGPSAGIAIFCSIASLLTNKPVRTDIAMTGEITLQGLVLPIGGLKEKLIAAKQAGIKEVILPKRNKKDMPDIPSEAKIGLKFHYAEKAKDVLKYALEK